jgi:hypothetical protein
MFFLEARTEGAGHRRQVCNAQPVRRLYVASKRRGSQKMLKQVCKLWRAPVGQSSTFAPRSLHIANNTAFRLVLSHESSLRRRTLGVKTHRQFLSACSQQRLRRRSEKSSRPSHRVSAVRCVIQSNRSDPTMNDASVLACRHAR